GFQRGAPPGRRLGAAMTFATFTPKARRQWQVRTLRPLPRKRGRNGNRQLRDLHPSRLAQRAKEDLPGKRGGNGKCELCDLYRESEAAMATVNFATFTRRNSRNVRRRAHPASEAAMASVNFAPFPRRSSRNARRRVCLVAAAWRQADDRRVRGRGGAAPGPGE